MPNSKLTPTSIFRVLTALTILCFILLTVLLYRYDRKSPVLPKLVHVSDFELTDSQNRIFNTAQLKGKVWTASLFFTTCSGVCPMLNGNLASIYRSYQLDPNVQFVSITVNPDNDTPDVLAAYAKKFHADPQKWHFLTGPIGKIQTISVDNLKTGNKEEPVFHSGHIALIDRDGWIRGYYSGLERSGTRDLFKDIAALLKEK